MNRRNRVLPSLLITLCLLLSGCGSVANPTSPVALVSPGVTPGKTIDQPLQPASGPGGTTYSFGSVKQTAYGENAEQYTLFEPANPTPKTAPVIVFLHGYGAIDSRFYYGWIEHLVRRGNIVIYPAYQQTLSGFEVFTPAMLKGVTAAFAELNQGQHVTPEADKVVVVGHSLGGVLTTVLAAYASDHPNSPIPRPRAIMLVEPGGYCLAECMAGLSRIDPATRMLVLVGDHDTDVGDETARQFWAASPQIPPANKDYITVVSDDHGIPILNANHYFPLSGKVLNTLHYYGTFKLLDALQSCTLAGRDCETALGGGPAQRFMGKWSDGQPVKELKVTKQP